MYYYLDNEDGYSKGPYTWEDLKRLPLAADTYIFDQQKVEWRTLEAYHAKMAAEAKASVKRSPKIFVPERPYNPTDFAPSPAPAPTPLPPRPAPSPIPEPTRRPAPGFPPPYDKRHPLPPRQAGPDDSNPMGISGQGCFILALVIALIMGGIFWVMW